MDLDFVSTKDLIAALMKRADTFVCFHHKEGNPQTDWWLSGRPSGLMPVLLAMQDTLNDWRVRDALCGRRRTAEGIEVKIFDEHLAARLAENEESGE